MLYQATVPLIPKGGKFVVVGSRAGVMSIPKTVAAGAYGQSKAAAHFLVRPPLPSTWMGRTKTDPTDPPVALRE